MKKLTSAILTSLTLIAVQHPSPGRAADWPQWRYDAGRTAASPQELPATLHLQWTREYPALEPAWRDPVNRDRMPYDRHYEPVVAGSRLFVGSSRNDSVTALDTRTGEELWRFYADGPVRLPPVAAEGKVYFVSDDGCLYCLNTADGTLAWKHRGAPGNRKILGNSRLISVWPARGGPVLADGIIHYAASIWPMEGVFIYALEAKTGKVVWANDRADVEFRRHPHTGADAFGGLAPQGAMAVVGDRLLVPGGRSVPACFFRSSGKLDYFHLGGSPSKAKLEKYAAKLEGGSHVCGIGSYTFNHRGINTVMYDLTTGSFVHMWKHTTYPVLTDSAFYMSGKTTRSYKPGSEKQVEKTWKLDPVWECAANSTTALIKAGKRLYAADADAVRAIDLDGTPRVSWQADIDGTPCRLIAADDRLFVVTLEGRILAFGPEPTPSPKEYRPTQALPAVPESAATLAESMAERAPLKRGYCLVLGLDKGELATAIAARTELRVIAIDPDAEKVNALRRELDAAGLYGVRISVHTGDPNSFGLPPYLAALTTSEKAGLSAAGVFDSMRPYGGIAYLPVEGDAALAELASKAASLPGAKVSKAGRYAVVRREGALPGSADWTHLNADVANTVKSNDKLVKLPLGLLWFGGSSHHDVLPRHGHGPTELVVGGRLIIQGVNLLSARDVYTGQVLWRREFDDLGTSGVYYDKTYVPNPLDTTYNQVHLAGANARGANYAAAEDGIYLLKGSDCLLLDPVTGETLKTITLPADNTGKTPAWGYIGIYEDLLIAGAGIIKFSEMTARKIKIWDNFDTSSSKRIVVMDRHTGEVRWTRDCKSAFRHNAIIAGAGRLFCIDATPKTVLSVLIPKGKAPSAQPELLALDIATGEQAWRKSGDAVFGTWLSYSKKHDALLQCGRSSDDMLSGEPDKRMMVMRGATGETVWDEPRSHNGPAMLHDRTIYLNATKKKAGSAVDLLTGEILMRHHPLTGTEQQWTYKRRYGCNSSICGEHLLTFRSGAAGFYDIARDGGLGNFSGFKSSCTANLVPANGVLNAPDYTRTCTCSYQNQTSVALVHQPEVELWTLNDFKWDNKPVSRVGINFGAPGDRRSDSGTLWLDHAETERGAAPSPDIPVEVQGASASFFRRHSSRIEAGELKWVGASGVTGMKSVALTLGGGAGRAATGGSVHTFQIAGSADDAEEAMNGALDLDSTDLEFTRDRQKKQIIGLRFSNVTIERADDIKHAHIQFTVDEATTVPTDLKLFGQAIVSAQPFGPGKPKISKRKRTQASVAWKPGAWNTVDESGAAQMTPDVGAILREIVSLPGWKSGNAVAILIDGTGKRVAKAFDGDAQGAPVLRINTGKESATPATQAPADSRTYTVRLVFAEPAEDQSGKRVFDVSLQGKTVMTDFDVFTAAAGRNRTVVREFPGVSASGKLNISFVSKVGEPLLCGVEVVAE